MKGSSIIAISLLSVSCVEMANDVHGSDWNTSVNVIPMNEDGNQTSVCLSQLNTLEDQNPSALLNQKGKEDILILEESNDITSDESDTNISSGSDSDTHKITPNSTLLTAYQTSDMPTDKFSIGYNANNYTKTPRSGSRNKKRSLSLEAVSKTYHEKNELLALDNKGANLTTFFNILKQNKEESAKKTPPPLQFSEEKLDPHTMFESLTPRTTYNCLNLVRENLEDCNASKNQEVILDMGQFLDILQHKSCAIISGVPQIACQDEQASQKAQYFVPMCDEALKNYLYSLGKGMRYMCLGGQYKTTKEASCFVYMDESGPLNLEDIVKIEMKSEDSKLEEIGVTLKDIIREAKKSWKPEGQMTEEEEKKFRQQKSIKLEEVYIKFGDIIRIAQQKTQAPLSSEQIAHIKEIYKELEKSKMDMVTQLKLDDVYEIAIKTKQESFIWIDSEGAHLIHTDKDKEKENKTWKGIVFSYTPSTNCSKIKLTDLSDLCFEFVEKDGLFIRTETGDIRLCSWSDAISKIVENLLYEYFAQNEFERVPEYLKNTSFGNVIKETQNENISDCS